VPSGRGTSTARSAARRKGRSCGPSPRAGCGAPPGRPASQPARAASPALAVAPQVRKRHADPGAGGREAVDRRAVRARVGGEHEAGRLVPAAAAMPWRSPVRLWPAGVMARARTPRVMRSARESLRWRSTGDGTRRPSRVRRPPAGGAANLVAEDALLSTMPAAEAELCERRPPAASCSCRGRRGRRAGREVERGARGACARIRVRMHRRRR
jgi:hypothetical protein